MWIRVKVASDLLYCRYFITISFRNFCETDFEFIDVNGKQASVPMVADGQDFNGRCIKQIAGLGAVYIRLTKPLLQVIDLDSDFEPHPKHVTVHESDSDSSFELPPFLQSSSSIPPPVNTAIPTSSAAISSASSTFTMPSSSSSMPSSSDIHVSDHINSPYIHSSQEFEEDLPPPAFIIEHSPSPPLSDIVSSPDSTPF